MFSTGIWRIMKPFHSLHLHIRSLLRELMMRITSTLPKILGWALLKHIRHAVWFKTCVLEIFRKAPLCTQKLLSCPLKDDSIGIFLLIGCVEPRQRDLCLSLSRKKTWKIRENFSFLSLWIDFRLTCTKFLKFYCSSNSSCTHSLLVGNPLRIFENC